MGQLLLLRIKEDKVLLYLQTVFLVSSDGYIALAKAAFLPSLPVTLVSPVNEAEVATQHLPEALRRRK